MAVPSFDEYLAAARSSVPGATDQEIRDRYRKVYDREPVLTRGPSLEQYKGAVRQLIPSVTDEEIEDRYRRVYGAPVSYDVGAGLRRGFGQLAEMVGTGLQFAGFEHTGADVGRFGRGVSERAAPAADISSTLRSGFIGGEGAFGGGGLPFIDLNLGMLRPDVLASEVATQVPALLGVLGAGAMGGPPAAMGVGAGLGALEGVHETYSETGDRGKAALAGLAYGALNVLPIERMFRGQGILGRGLASALLESGTEFAEEPVGMAIRGEEITPEALRQASAVIPPAFALGLLGAGGASARGGGTSATPGTVADALAQAEELAAETQEAEAPIAPTAAPVQPAAPEAVRPLQEPEREPESVDPDEDLPAPPPASLAQRREQLQESLQSIEDPEIRSTVRSQIKLIDAEIAGQAPKLTLEERQRLARTPLLDDTADVVLRKIGGLDTTIETDWAGRLKDSPFDRGPGNRNIHGVSVGGLERPGSGVTLSEFTERIWELGFIPRNDEALASEILDRIEHGERVFNPRGSASAFEEMAREHERREVPEYDFAEGPAATLDELIQRIGQIDEGEAERLAKLDRPDNVKAILAHDFLNRSGFAVEEGGVRYEIGDRVQGRRRGPVSGNEGARSASGSQMDLFTPRDRQTGRVPFAGAGRVGFARVGTYRGPSRIQGPEDALRLAAPLRKHPQENVVAIVTDDAGNVLSVIRHTIGTTDASQVDVSVLAGGIASVPNAKRVWFAHNHPSASPELSMADKSITMVLEKALSGAGIRTEGMLTVTTGGRGQLFDPNIGVTAGGTFRARPLRRSEQSDIPVTERRFEKLPVSQSPSLRSPDDVRAFLQALDADGVLLVNTHRKPLSFLKIPSEEQEKLFVGGVGARDLLKEIHKVNAHGMFVVGRYRGTQQIETFADRAKIRLLDKFTRKTGRVERHANVVDPSLGDAPRRLKSKRVRERSERYNATVEDVTKNWKRGPKVFVVDLPESIPDEYLGPLRQQYRNALGRLKGLRVDDTVYLVAENINGVPELKSVLAHEAVGHWSFQEMLGDRWDWLVNELENLRARDREIQRAYERVISSYGEQDADTLASEVVAHLAQENPQHSLVQRVLSWVREWLRERGLSIKLSRADLNSMLVRAAKRLEKPAAEVMTDRIEPMIAYHGSQHLFKRFSTEKIGTGEGAQVFGWGIYLAENPEVAKSYVAAGVPGHLGQRQQNIVQKALRDYPGDERAARASIFRKAMELAPDKRQTHFDAYNNFEELKETGNIYEVEVPDEAVSRMLDWDKPMSEQTELLAAFPEEFKAEVEDLLDSAGLAADLESLSGGEFYQTLERAHERDILPPDPIELERALRPDEAASRFLLRQGIPGLKYLDQGSRGATGIKEAEGTRNLVVFDDSIITIKSINGKPVPKVEPALAPERPTHIESGGGRFSTRKWAELSNAEVEVLRSTAAQFEGQIEKQRRGKIPWTATEAAAFEKIKQQHGVALKELVARKPGSTANAEDLEAYAMLLGNATREVEQQARLIQENPSDENLVQLFALSEKLALLQAPFYGYSAEAGRALNILRKITPIAKDAGDILENLPDLTKGDVLTNRDAIIDFANGIVEGGDPNETMTKVRELHDPTLWDKFYEYWINAILSGYRTHEVNLTSNALYTMVENLARFAAVPFSKEVTLRQATSRLAGMVHGFGLGAKLAKAAFLTESPQLNPISKLEVEAQKAIKGKAGAIIRLPGRFLLAEDELFKGIAYSAELYEQAMRLAEKEQPGNARQRFREILANIDQHPELVRKARDGADKLTFTTKLPPAMAAVNLALRKTKVGKLLVPFVRTPTNIVKSALEYLPGVGAALPSVREDLSGKNGADRRAIALGRWMIGTGMVTTIYSLAAQGLISGNGPDDPREKAMLRTTGWEPYSFNGSLIGKPGQWIKYNRFEPVGMILGLAADTYEIGNYSTSGEIERLHTMILSSLMMNLGDKTFLKGVFDFAEAMSDPERYFTRWANSMAVSVIPNMVNQIAYSTDPYFRDAQTLVDEIRARFPQTRTDLPVRRDVFGEPIPSTVVPWTPFNVSEERDNPLAVAMLNLGIVKGRLSRTVRNAKLTEEEYEDFVTSIGQARRNALEPLVRSPQFQQLMTQNPEAARAVLERQWDNVTEDARTAWIFRNPRILQRGIEERTRPRAIGSTYRVNGG